MALDTSQPIRGEYGGHVTGSPPITGRQPLHWWPRQVQPGMLRLAFPGCLVSSLNTLYHNRAQQQVVRPVYWLIIGSTIRGINNIAMFGWDGDVPALMLPTLPPLTLSQLWMLPEFLIAQILSGLQSEHNEYTDDNEDLSFSYCTLLHRYVQSIMKMFNCSNSMNVLWTNLTIISLSRAWRQSN